jgi:octaprenyl-diphosphate synthase
MRELAATIKSDLDALEKNLPSFLETGDSFQDKISAHIFRAGGKRVRPALFLAIAKALGWQHENRFAIAAALEYIHTASLLHDDVIDNASTRRGKPTVNALWDNTIAILSGDRVHATASRLFIRARSFELFDSVCEAVQKMSESEIFQLTILWKQNTNQQDYNAVVHGKTAKLFEVCASAAPYILNLPAHTTECFAAYGRHIGFAFQIVDDCLDFTSTEKELGKPILVDLCEGKITLPLILAMASGCEASIELKNRVIEICEHKASTPENLLRVQHLVHQANGVELARAQAKKEIDSALQNLNAAFQSSPAQNSAAAEALMRVPNIILERNS